MDQFVMKVHPSPPCFPDRWHKEESGRESLYWIGRRKKDLGEEIKFKGKS